MKGGEKMEAAAIIAASAVSCDNRMPANAPQVNGDFKMILQQEVQGQTGEAAAQPLNVGPEELQRLIQALLAALTKAGLPEGMINPGVVNNAGTADIEMSGLAVSAGNTGNPVMAGTIGVVNPLLAGTVPSPLLTGITPNQANTTNAANTANTINTTNTTNTTKTTNTTNTTNITNTTNTTNTTDTLSPANTADSANTVRDVPVKGTVPANTLNVMQNLIIGQANSVPASENNTPAPILTSDAIPQDLLTRKISELVHKLVLGEEITEDFKALMKDFGPAPVIKAVREMVDGLKGNSAILGQKDAIMQKVSGDFPAFPLEKPAVEATISASDAKTTEEQTGQTQQVRVTHSNEGAGSFQQDMGQGTGENHSFVNPPGTESTARFVTAQSADTVKATVNNFARWTEDILGKIGENARLILGSGQSEMQIQLKPDFLGKINLQVTMENGQVTARIGVENLQVKELVEANIKQLQQNLDSQGIKVGNLVVDLSANRQFQHFNRNHEFGAGKAAKTRISGISEDYGGLPANNSIAPAGWSNLNGTVDYIA